jgi:hypothetical protein
MPDVRKSRPARAAEKIEAPEEEHPQQPGWR